MNSKFINWFILISLALIWGSSFILMKRGMDVFSSDEVAALRMFLAFIFLAPFIFKHVKKDVSKNWKGFLGTGMLGNFIPAFLFTKAETGLSSALTGVLNSLTPLFVLLLGVSIFKAKTHWSNVLGILIGFIGAIGLLTVGKNVDVTNNLQFGSYIVLATISYALSVNIIRYTLYDVSPITTSVWSMLFVGPLAGVYLFGFTDFTAKLNHPLAMQSIGYICILAGLGTSLSVIIFNLLIKNTNALFASSVTYLIPIVAMGWGIFDGEAIFPQHFLWICLILLGVYFVNKRNQPTLKER